MKIVDIVAVAIRILGLVFLYKLLTTLPVVIDVVERSFSALSFTSLADQNFVYILPFYLTELVICVLAIRFPRAMARFFISREQLDTSIQFESVEILQTSGFVIIGVYMISQALPDLALNIARLVHMSGQAVPDEEQTSKSQIFLLVTVVQLVVGSMLTFGSKGLQKLIARARG